MPAFRPYAGSSSDSAGAFRWSCYATTPVYEVRTFEGELPASPEGRKWVCKQEGRQGPQLAVLVDREAGGFSQILTQINNGKASAAA